MIITITSTWQGDPNVPSYTLPDGVNASTSDELEIHHNGTGGPSSPFVVSAGTATVNGNKGFNTSATFTISDDTTAVEFNLIANSNGVTYQHTLGNISSPTPCSLTIKILLFEFSFAPNHNFSFILWM